MSAIKPKNIFIIAVIALTAGITAGIYLDSKEQAELQSRQATVLGEPRKIAVPELYKHDGSRFAQEDIRGRWSLMFFGFTHCPDVCPFTLSNIAQAKKQAAQQPDFKFPQVWFVSVDPQRDTIDIIGDYVTYFDPEFIGVTGDKKMIEALTLQLSVMSMRVPSTTGSEDDYQIEHSASILLINPEGKLHAFLQPPHDPQTMVNRVSQAIENYSG